MELNLENFSAIIYYEFRRILIQQQCVDKLVSTCGNGTSHRATMFCWFAEFNRSRRLLKDEFLECSKSVVLLENIDTVRDIIRLDRHVTYS